MDSGYISDVEASDNVPAVAVKKHWRKRVTWVQLRREPLKAEMMG